MSSQSNELNDEELAPPAEHKNLEGWIPSVATDAEIRAFLAAAKAEADKANIPEEPVEFDPSDEIKRIIDKAMGEQLAEELPAAEPPAAEQAPETEVPQAESPPSNSQN